MTDKGRAVWEEALGVQAEKEALFAAALTAREREQLDSLLRRLMLAFESVGSTSSRARLPAHERPGRLAQLVERLLYTQVAAGSSPAPPITSRLTMRERLETAGQAAHGCRESTCGAVPGADLEIRTRAKAATSR